MNDSLPSSLARYQDALEDAIRRELGAGRTRRRLAVRAVLAATALAAVALGALAIVSRLASGASVVDRAAAAIARSPGTILHVDLVGSQTGPTRSSIVTWRDESWQQESFPFARRQIETSPDGSVAESGSTNHSEQLYDPKTNTIYVSHSSPETTRQPTLKIVRGPRPGTFVLRMHPAPYNAKPLVITARQAKAFRKGALVLGFRISKKNGLVTASPTLMPAPHTPPAEPSTPDPDPTSGDFRDQILALLNSGGAHVAGHRTIDGRDVIEIDSADGHTTYYVDPESYAPVELRTRGTGGGTTLRFRTYEKLELDGNGSLLSLAAQHPTALVDRDSADYQAALARLFPKG